MGFEQTLTLTGPESIVVDQVVSSDATTVTTQTHDYTTSKYTTETLNRGTLASSISGNATEPWNTTYSFPGSGGWQTVTTHGNDSALTSATTYDSLGRMTRQEAPSPTGSGMSATTYGYTGGRLTSATDLVAT